MGIELKVRFKKGVDFDILRNYGFTWDTFSPVLGTIWKKGDVECYSKTEEIEYKKLTQETFDILLELLLGGVLEKIK